MSAPTLTNRMTAADWRPYVKGTLLGFFSLTLPSGMIVHGLTLHRKGSSSWVGMPGQKFTKTDGTAAYTPILEFTSRATADRFRDLAIEALRESGVTA